MATKKRGNNEGSIRQRRDGRWEARVMLESGRQRSLYGKTRQEAARLLAAAKRDLDQGLPLADERQTVAQYLDQWLETVRHTLKPRTWARYELDVRCHLKPQLGSARLSKLTAQRVQALYAAKLASGLASSTVAHLHAVLHEALDTATRQQLVPRNVTDLVTPPRARKKEMLALNPEQARILLRAAEGDRLEALYVLALTTGMRQGELLGLTWEDVDLDVGRLHVRHSLRHKKGGQWALDTPKTAASRRQVELSRTAIEALRGHRARQLQERLVGGPGWSDHDLVFARANGEPLRGTHVLQRYFLPLLTRAGLPRIRFHDLRHTAATLLLLQGTNPKVVSEILGHTDVALTLGLYSHVLPSMQRDAAAAMDALLAQ